MKLIIHDLEDRKREKLLPKQDDAIIISDDKSIKNCIGCFGCWIKTPGECVIKDKYSNIGELLSKCDEVIIISKCFYGGYSPFIKNVLDRSISYAHPYFEIRNGEMHHKHRYSNKFNLTVWFYGENISEQEKITAKNMVQANIVNFECGENTINFISEIENIGEGVL